MNRRLRRREMGGLRSTHFASDIDVTRLEVVRQLEGHRGCVNCLQWNKAGTLLASGSDDQHIFIWGIDGRKRHSFRTGHTNNIFSVQFLPASSSDVIFSAAGDHTVRLHAIDRGATTESFCWNHGGRVKRMAVSYGDPYLAWAAVEDGHIMQYDVRTNAADELLSYPKAECKSVAVNPCRTEMLAVAGSDPTVRVYDRRFIADPLLNLVPGHISITEHLRRNHFRALSVTHVAFTSGGDQLLSNIGGEQLYLFDLLNNNNRDVIEEFERLFPSETIDDEQLMDLEQPALLNGYKSKANGELLEKIKEKVDQQRATAKEHFENKRYTKAIDIYSDLIRQCRGKSAVLLANRGAGYYNRNWDGDPYAAFRDSLLAMQHDPNHSKAHYRLVSSLIKLNQVQLARRAQQAFQAKYPDEKSSTRLDKLVRIAASGDEVEKEWVLQGVDCTNRYCGHCNTSTDIKEAMFFGGRDEYVVAGSDCGSLVIWQRDTGRMLAAYDADEQILNCVQPHPVLPMLATSGIEHHVRLWQPHSAQDECWTGEKRRINDLDRLAEANQKRMRANPLELILQQAGYQFRAGGGGEEADEDGDDEARGPAVQCLQS